MATSAQTLIQRTRRVLRDWPDEEALSSSLSSSATSITVTDGTQYFANEVLEIDTEILKVRSISTNTLTVARASQGTTAASHANAATILRNPNFFSVELIDALNDGLDAAWPHIWRRVVDTSTTISTATIYEYTVPTDSSTAQQFPNLFGVAIQEPGDLTYRPIRRWYLVRGSGADKFHFKFQPTPGATVRLTAGCRFPRLVNLTDTLDTQWPQNLEYPLAEFAAASMLASGEAARVRVDRGVLDSREQANQVGSSSAASQFFMQRYLYRVMNSGYPPMPNHLTAI